jgi:hypothetical protein
MDAPRKLALQIPQNGVVTVISKLVNFTGFIGTYHRQYEDTLSGMEVLHDRE